MSIENTIAKPLSPSGARENLRGGSSVPLAESAMLVSLKISGWTARKKDKRVTAEVALSHKLGVDAGAYWKQLLQKSAVNRVRAAAQAAREIHYRNTLPWEDEGARILPSKNFARYRSELRGAFARWEAARDEFLKEYSSLVEQAEKDLNGLFNANDYPASDLIGSKFGWVQRTNPVPSAEDFRVNVGNGERARIKAEIQESQSAWVKESSTTLWRRLYEVVDRFSTAVGNDKQVVYRSSLINGMKEVCGLLPSLNVSGDAELEKMRQAVESKLCKHDAASFGRDEDSVAHTEEVAKEAASILTAMSVYTG